jgi:hypothetical protein
MASLLSIRFIVQLLYRIFCRAAILGLIWVGLAVAAEAQSDRNQPTPHGGIVLTAATQGLHLEAVWPTQGVIRVFVYDEMMRPLPPEELSAISGQIVVHGAAFALQPSRKGFLEAGIPSIQAPAQMTLRLLLSPGTNEEFPLAFRQFSEDGQAFDFMLPPTAIPDTLSGLLEALRDDARNARASVNGQELIFAYAPAVHARDHVLALEAYLPGLAPRNRPRAEAAILAAVRAAWLLHIAADAGISPWHVSGSVGVLTEALDDVIGAFGGASR